VAAPKAASSENAASEVKMPETSAAKNKESTVPESETDQ
jgi:hypothetical protein